MEKMMRTWAVFVLAVHCSGFPVYDYDPASLRAALAASVAKVNSQALSPFLFRPFRSSIKRASVLDEDILTMDIEFSIRETTCRKDSGEDPSTCDFQRGYFAPAAVCRSTVQIAAEQVQGVWVRCRWSSSSESNSSEEMIFGDIFGSYKRRNNYLLDVIPGELRSEQLNGRSREITRRGFPPGNRRHQDRWYRARLHSGFE
ncbi:secreted phosphoprotein 24 [Dasypus novemcinctus]|uniref:secreted phosphoprotein 24 n=1 Tax=Dasypus novemcinctus TaxID=9361 RepID=UPI00265FBAFF|nr:secreted phosphoprotein 24 [Dasypus novemcinctus]XP_058155840.1 secreted phosphoprotein 24 [Dasypus novemcinctus]